MEFTIRLLDQFVEGSFQYTYTYNHQPVTQDTLILPESALGQHFLVINFSDLQWESHSKALADSLNLNVGVSLLTSPFFSASKGNETAIIDPFGGVQPLVLYINEAGGDRIACQIFLQTNQLANQVVPKISKFINTPVIKTFELPTTGFEVKNLNKSKAIANDLKPELAEINSELNTLNDILNAQKLRQEAIALDSITSLSDLDSLAEDSLPVAPEYQVLSLFPEIESTKDSLFIDFKNTSGNSFYALRFSSDTGEHIVEFSETKVTQSIHNIVDEMGTLLPPGDYKIALLNPMAPNSGEWIDLEKSLTIAAAEAPQSGLGLTPFFIGGAALLGLLLFLGFRKNKSPKKSQKEQLASGSKTTPPAHSPLAAEALNSTKILIKTRNQEGVKETPQLPKETADRLKEHYQELSLSAIWSESQIEKIYLGKTFIEELDHFLQNKNIAFIEEQEGEIPEIGGMVMGNKFKNEAGQFIVSVEKLVEIQPEKHNTFQLQFSTESLGLDLSTFQDEFPEYELVGWFHTHPGHGLFLSKADLAIHNGYFIKPYQFAMEIDSLTEQLDTTFFTRKMDGTVNNAIDQIPDTSWFHWKKIKEATEAPKTS